MTAVSHGGAPFIAVSDDRRRRLRRGFRLEWITLGWNAIGIGVPASAAIAARSVALIDGILAAVVLRGLVLIAAAGWWWADPFAACILVYCAARDARETLAQANGP